MLSALLATLFIAPPVGPSKAESDAAVRVINKAMGRAVRDRSGRVTAVSFGPHSRVTDDVAKALAPLTDLVSLDMHFASVTDAGLVHQHTERCADFAFELLGGNPFLQGHEARPAFLLDLDWNRVGQRIGRRALDRRVGEAAHAVEPGFFQEAQQLRELGLGLAGETDDEGAAHRDIRADGSPALQPLHSTPLRWTQENTLSLRCVTLAANWRDSQKQLGRSRKGNGREASPGQDTSVSREHDRQDQTPVELTDESHWQVSRTLRRHASVLQPDRARAPSRPSAWTSALSSKSPRKPALALARLAFLEPADPADRSSAVRLGWHERPARLTVLVPARLWPRLASQTIDNTHCAFVPLVPRFTTLS